MYCNKCGFNNEDGYTFCGKCGTPLAGANNQISNYGQHVSTLNEQAINPSGAPYTPGSQMNTPGAYPYPNGNLNPQNVNQNYKPYMVANEGLAPTDLKYKYNKEYKTAKIIAIVTIVIMIILGIFFYVKNYEHNKEVREILGSDSDYWWY